MKKICIYKQHNSAVAVLYPSEENDVCILDICKKDVPKGTEYKIISTDSLPKNISYFDAWLYDDPIKIDIMHAHEIKKSHMRRLREPILKSLDLEFMKALENGLPTDKIVQKKNQLRDVTKLPLPEWIEGDTVESFSDRLDKFLPDCLKN